jgi:hypothetical protein
MQAGNPTVCPKCNYSRTAADSAPAWQCPSCGIAYKKFKDASGPQAGKEAAAQSPAADLRVRTLSVGESDTAGSTAMTVYGGVVFIFFFLPIFFMRSAGSEIINWLPVSIAVCAFIFWLSAYRRLRMTADVPTSTIAAAAQGYVELHGTAVAAPGDSLIGQLTRMPCVWNQFTILKEDKDGKPYVDERSTRGVPFILRDKTGDCVIDPEKAEVICDRCQSGHRWQEWSIRVGDPVYAIGYFSSGGAAAERHVNMKVAYALAAQERDKAAYTARYDANQDGKVHRQEVALERDALRREAMKEYVGQGGVHTLGPAPDGRPFLVIGANHEDVDSRYRRLTVIHLCVFIASLGVAAYMWKM